MALVKIHWNPSTKELRSFLLILPGFSLLFVLLLHHRGASLLVAAWVVFVATVLSALGFFFRPLARLLFVGLMLLSFPIGFVVSHLVLGGIFYLVITPLGLLMRLFGRDVLGKTFDREKPSYFVRRTDDPNAPVDVKRYLRQF